MTLDVNPASVLAFKNLFAGNPQKHYVFHGGIDYGAIDHGITDEDIARHFRGEKPSLLSVPVEPSAPLSSEYSVPTLSRFGALDPDRHEPDDIAIDHVALARRVTELGLPLIVCQSKSPKSAHLYLFLLEKNGFSSETTQRLLNRYRVVLELTGIVEVFPKQREMKIGDTCNGINLPFFGDTRLAYGKDGEILSLEEFIALAHERSSYGSVLQRRDLTVETSVSSVSASTEKKFQPITFARAEEIFTELLDDLRKPSDRPRHDRMHAATWFAARIFTTNPKVLGSESVIKNRILATAQAVSPEDHAWQQRISREASQSWNDGARSVVDDPVNLVEISTLEDLKRPDMPESVLDGKLGRWCRERLGDFSLAYSWPSILGAASVLVKPTANVRCNLYICLVGPMHSAKSTAQERADILFNLQALDLLNTKKCGSAEGLAEQIGDRGGRPILWNPDELSHVLAKSQIEGASFPFVLNSMFYNDSNQMVVQKRKAVSFNARLSLTGGVVEDHFGDSFGASTNAGLYDRFLFGLVPTGFTYLFRPMEGKPLFDVRAAQTTLGIVPQGPNAGPVVLTPTIDSSVWDARDAIHKAEGIEPRVLEIALRTALICAAWDGRTELRASDLEPAWELARYQQSVRLILKPNPGKNFEAVAAHKVLSFLKSHSDGEKWVAMRDILRATHVTDYGPSTVDRAMASMVFSGTLEKVETKSKTGGRPKQFYKLAA